MYSDRKQIRDCLQTGLGGGGSRQTANRRVIITGQEETAGWGGGGGHVHYLAGGESFMGVYICQTHQILHFQYVPFIVCQLYLNTNVKANKPLPKL